MSSILKETIQVIGQSIGIANLSDEAAAVLAPDVEYRMREIMQEAIKCMRHSKRCTLSTDDVNSALCLRNVEPLYGFTGGGDPIRFRRAIGHPDLYYIEDREMSINEIISEAPLPKCPVETSVGAHWFACNGVQPAIPENAPIALPSNAKKIDFPAVAGANDKDDTSSMTEIKLPVRHVLSRELQLYRDKVQELIMAKAGKRLLSAVYSSLATGAGLHQLVPYFTQFVADKVKQHLDDVPLIFLLMRFVRSLLLNPHIQVETYLHQLMSPVLTSLVVKRLGGKSSMADHWELRNFSANLVGFICRRFGPSYQNLQPRIMKTLVHAFLDPKKAMTQHYGAIKGLSVLGNRVVELVLLPSVGAYLEALFSEMDSVKQQNELKRYEAWRCYGALLSACGSCMYSRLKSCPLLLQLLASGTEQLRSSAKVRKLCLKPTAAEEPAPEAVYVASRARRVTGAKAFCSKKRPHDDGASNPSGSQLKKRATSANKNVGARRAGLLEMFPLLEDSGGESSAVRSQAVGENASVFPGKNRCEETIPTTTGLSRIPLSGDDAAAAADGKSQSVELPQLGEPQMRQAVEPPQLDNPQEPAESPEPAKCPQPVETQQIVEPPQEVESAQQMEPPEPLNTLQPVEPLRVVDIVPPGASLELSRQPSLGDNTGRLGDIGEGGADDVAMEENDNAILDEVKQGDADNKQGISTGAEGVVAQGDAGGILGGGKGEEGHDRGSFLERKADDVALAEAQRDGACLQAAEQTSLPQVHGASTWEGKEELDALEAGVPQKEDISEPTSDVLICREGEDGADMPLSHTEGEEEEVEGKLRPMQVNQEERKAVDWNGKRRAQESTVAYAGNPQQCRDKDGNVVGMNRLQGDDDAMAVDAPESGSSEKTGDGGNTAAKGLEQGSRQAAAAIADIPMTCSASGKQEPFGQRTAGVDTTSAEDARNVLPSREDGGANEMPREVEGLHVHQRMDIAPAAGRSRQSGQQSGQQQSETGGSKLSEREQTGESREEVVRWKHVLEEAWKENSDTGVLLSSLVDVFGESMLVYVPLPVMSMFI